MNNLMTQNVLNSGKMWVLAILAVFAVSLMVPAEVSAKISENDNDMTSFDQYVSLYFRQSKLTELKNDKTKTAVSTVKSAKSSNKQLKTDPVKGLQTFYSTKYNYNTLTVAGIETGQKPDNVVRAVITAYTSTPDQTDSTPDIGASGKHVYDGMIAANWLPFGTKVKIPALYGDKIFTVDDRMNKRYGYGRMDVWLDASRAEAMKFGVKRVEIEVYRTTKTTKQLVFAK
jgi:3D (Asp-Asp-Asp) domain-containing protein